MAMVVMVMIMVVMMVVVAVMVMVVIMMVVIMIVTVMAMMVPVRLVLHILLEQLVHRHFLGRRLGLICDEVDHLVLVQRSAELRVYQSAPFR